MMMMTRSIAVVGVLLLTGCGGSATSYSGAATGGDGVRGNVSPNVSLSLPCRTGTTTSSPGSTC